MPLSWMVSNLFIFFFIFISIILFSSIFSMNFSHTNIFSVPSYFWCW